MPLSLRERCTPGPDARRALLPRPNRHLGGSLTDGRATAGKSMRFDVELRSFDKFAFEDVRAVKIDVEGSEPAVLAGGCETILRDRPPLIVELLTGAHADPAAATETISATSGLPGW